MGLTLGRFYSPRCLHCGLMISALQSLFLVPVKYESPKRVYSQGFSSCFCGGNLLTAFSLERRSWKAVGGETRKEVKGTKDHEHVGSTSP